MRVTHEMSEARCRLHVCEQLLMILVAHDALPVYRSQKVVVVSPVASAVEKIRKTFLEDTIFAKPQDENGRRGVDGTAQWVFMPRCTCSGSGSCSGDGGSDPVCADGGCGSGNVPMSSFRPFLFALDSSLRI